MTDHHPPFVPPEGVPDGRAARTSAAPVAEVVHPVPPVRHEHIVAAATPPEPRRIGSGARVAIMVGSILLGTIIVVGVLLAALALAGRQDGGAISTGEPQPTAPDAAIENVAVACPPECFGPADTVRARPSIVALRALGLSSTLETFGTSRSTAVSEELDALDEAWRSSDGEPDRCAFAFAPSPVVPGEPVANATERMQRLDSYVSESGESTLSQSIRVFQSTADAEAHLQRLERAIEGCDVYSYSTDGADSGDVTVEEYRSRLRLPGGVRAAGWSEPTFGAAFVAVDLQRGNVVVRTVLATANREIGPADLAAFLESYGAQLGGLDIDQLD